MESEIGRSAIGRAMRRLIPFLFVLYVFNYLDRLNVSAAALTMQKDLGFSESIYGLGAGIFFIGYFLFEVPSNLILQRVGARRWIARIMISWGIVSTAMMFVRTPHQFYALRFLLGVAEAGFFPGIVLYLTYWFPSYARARAAAVFMVATTFSNVIGSPLAAILIDMQGVMGLHGWQWLFLVEGLPSSVLGVAVLFYLTDRPEHAHWMPAEERAWLIAEMEREHGELRARHSMGLIEGLRHPRVLHIAAMFLLMQTSGYGFGFFGPLILKARTNWDPRTVLWVNAIPSVFGVAAMLIGAAISDKTGERRRFLIGGLAVQAVAMAACAALRAPLATVACFTLLSIAGAVLNAPFWAYNTSFLTGTAAAGGIALINSVGNLGGTVGTVLVGQLKARSTSYASGLYTLAVLYACAAVLAWFLRQDRPPNTRTPEHLNT